MRKIALVTAREVGALDEDMAPLMAALRAEGVEAEPVLWDDPKVEWAAYVLALVRSPWDYVPRREEFLGWAARAERAVPVANPPAILRWNTDKHYLRDLASAGVPVVPTHFIEPGDPISFPFPGAIVVKPSVGAGSMDVERHAAADGAAEDHVRRLQKAGRGVMVQPYLERIDETGETGLVFLGGEYSHAVRKKAMLRGTRETLKGLFFKEEIRPHAATPAEREVAERAIGAAPEPLLYARVDVVPGPDARPLVLEFEATEPSLWLPLAPGSDGRFARAILRRLGISG